MEERWLSVVGYPDYLVSDRGRVWSTIRRRFNTGNRRPCGYIQHRIKRPDGTDGSKYLHHMMAEAFIPNPLGLPFVRHLDDNPWNNDLSNLAWGTKRDNHNDCVRNGHFHHLTDDDRAKARLAVSMAIVAINLNSGERYLFESQSEAGRALNIDPKLISRAMLRSCTHVRGWYFMKQDDDPIDVPIIDTNYHRQKPWIVATNVITRERLEFEGLTAASKELDISKGYISAVLHGKFVAAKGWRFEYLND